MTLASRPTTPASRPPILDAIGHTPAITGPSTGATISSALRIAGRPGEGRRVATVLVDSGLKDLGGELFR